MGLFYQSFRPSNFPWSNTSLLGVSERWERVRLCTLGFNKCKGAGSARGPSPVDGLGHLGPGQRCVWWKYPAVVSILKRHLTACVLYNHCLLRSNFDAVAYESIVVGFFSIITGKRCNPPRPFGRGGEQDAVYVGFSRDGFNFQRSPVRSRAFLPMSKTLHAW